MMYFPSAGLITSKVTQEQKENSQGSTNLIKIK